MTDTITALEPQEQILYDQLNTLLLEVGTGEILYEISGEGGQGLDDDALKNKIEEISKMAQKLKCDTFIAGHRKVKPGTVTDMLIRQTTSDKFINVRIAVCGNVDSGKSTLIGVLCTGENDDGRGSARLHCFNHKHEIETGRTSSIGEQIMGFNTKGECVNKQSKVRKIEWTDIIENSFKIISFYDLAGHEKYLKTTVSGMTGNMPDYCFLLIGANMGVTKMTKEHLGLALSLKIPVIVLITKIDIAPENVKKQTMNDIYQILKMRGIRKMPTLMQNDDDIISCVKSIANNDRLVPVFEVSSVQGNNLDLLRRFLNILPPRIQWKQLIDHPAEVCIEQTYYVTGVGTIVGGTVMSGVVDDGQTMLLGPDSTGNFIPVTIKSIQSNRLPVKQASSGQSAGFALKKIKRTDIHKGMFLVHPSNVPKACWTFEADVVVLYHSTTIQKNYQPVVQCLTIRQSAKITDIKTKEVLRTGDRANVRFKFLYHPEYLKVGMRLIFREGRCKGLGIVSSVGVDDERYNKKDDPELKKRDKREENQRKRVIHSST